MKARINAQCARQCHRQCTRVNTRHHTEVSLSPKAEGLRARVNAALPTRVVPEKVRTFRSWVRVVQSPEQVRGHP